MHRIVLIIVSYTSVMRNQISKMQNWLTTNYHVLLFHIFSVKQNKHNTCFGCYTLLNVKYVVYYMIMINIIKEIRLKHVAWTIKILRKFKCMVLVFISFMRKNVCMSNNWNLILRVNDVHPNWYVWEESRDKTNQLKYCYVITNYTNKWH